jgi:hypothetical protein
MIRTPALYTARALTAPPVTRLGLIAQVRGLDAPLLAALSGVPVAVVETLIAGGAAAANTAITPYQALARVLGVPTHVLLAADPCPVCLATEGGLDGRCPVCEVAR